MFQINIKITANHNTGQDIYRYTFILWTYKRTCPRSCSLFSAVAPSSAKPAQQLYNQQDAGAEGGAGVTQPLGTISNCTIQTIWPKERKCQKATGVTATEKFHPFTPSRPAPVSLTRHGFLGRRVGGIRVRVNSRRQRRPCSRVSSSLLSQVTEVSDGIWHDDSVR